MKAMLLKRIASLQDNPAPLTLEDIPAPKPAPDEVLIQISACGVCHTELDEIEGRTPPPVLPIVPGHEVIGRITEAGESVTKLDVGDRVGVGWIFKSSGEEDENISNEFVATGRDANGGYAEYMTVHERYAYRIPDCFSDYEAAPLLCAGGVGYRALSLTNISNGDILGLTGFGGSGHLVLQLASYLYPDSPVYVFARSPEERKFAIELGAAWAGDTDDEPPEQLHAKSLLADIDYSEHLWQEKELKTVANVTSHDIKAFLEIAAAAGIRPEVQVFRLDEANKALNELHAGHIRGAKVLAIGDGIQDH